MANQNATTERTNLQTKRCSNDEAVALRKNHVGRHAAPAQRRKSSIIVVSIKAPPAAVFIVSNPTDVPRFISVMIANSAAGEIASVTRCPCEFDLERPTRVVERANGDTICVFPITVAVG